MLSTPFSVRAIWCAPCPNGSVPENETADADNGCAFDNSQSVLLLQVCAAASFLLAQKLHLCAHSIPKVAACFVDACLHQLESKHSVLLAQPMQSLIQLRAANVHAKKTNADNQKDLRSQWDTEHAVRLNSTG